ncbi:hypothetical protein [Nocardiopsis sp. NRRL B-16309]|uniref:hypothetical protein n=1 Tax=Nocardiopsis sp. NRRL B-16309 TaxID=1519494 RepID=UPI000B1C84E7|nr:hypothetical protein [Nocardiopsis sp. NRRL B-16309]
MDDAIDASRVVTPDALAFFHHYVIGPGYAEIHPDGPDPEDHLLDDLRRLGLV